MRNNPGQTFSIYQIAEALGQNFSNDGSPFTKAFTSNNIISGFRCTGIYPNNRYIFSDEDFQSSSVTDRAAPQPTATRPVTPPPSTSAQAISNQDLRTPQRNSSNNQSNERDITPEDVIPYPLDHMV